MSLNETSQLYVQKSKKGSFVGVGENTWKAENDGSVLNDVDILYSP